MASTGVVLRRALVAASLGWAGLAGWAAPAQAQSGVTLRPVPEPNLVAVSSYYANHQGAAAEGYARELDQALDAAPPLNDTVISPAPVHAAPAACDSCETHAPVTCCQPCFAAPRCLDRWYVSVSGAWQHREDVHEVNDPLVFLEFDDGFAANAALGYRFDLFRVEVEYSFFNNEVERAGSGRDLNAIGIGPSNATGNINMRALMFNIYHDIQLPFTLWTPYIGAGLGTYQSEINSLYPDFFDTAGAPFAGQTVNSTSDFVFAYQFRAGASRQLGERTELFTGYRYFKGEDLTFSSPPFATFAPTFNPDGAETHSLELGLRIRF